MTSILLILGLCVLVPIGLFVTVPLVLSLLATSNVALGRNKASDDANDVLQKSALCVGRVWHARFLPKVHAFNYPIFMFALDLEELSAFRKLLGPLGWIVQFRESDHMINGEGMPMDDGKALKSSTKSQQTSSTTTMIDRIFRLAATKTHQKFQPNLATHRVVLLTHLCYYGYNFNPVSFYYIVERSQKEERIAAIVGEVSNTPWCEMYCYVLHPDSSDNVTFVNEEGKESLAGKPFDCTFPKTFHVSPFMEMDYLYAWKFDGIPVVDQAAADNKEITVINQLRRGERLHFNAKLRIEARQITALAVAWQLIRFPIFCVLIQIWIHYEAAWLFLKGVAYIPHPNDAETAASKIIATIMTPFFAIRDQFDPKSKTQ